MVGAVLLCGLGYAEGAVLSRRIGGWQVISWALVVALPLTLAATWLAAPAGWPAISGAAWLSLVYVSVFSMWIGFIFWYRGLAQGRHRRRRTVAAAAAVLRPGAGGLAAA